MQKDEVIWWHDTGSTRLNVAFDRLERKKQFGVRLKKLNQPTRVLGWWLVVALVVIVMPVVVVVTRSLGVSLSLGSGIALVILCPLTLQWLNNYQASKLEASIRRGAFGSAVMRSDDAEWNALDDALALWPQAEDDARPNKVNLDNVTTWASSDPTLRCHLANYLNATQNERREIRMGRAPSFDNWAQIALREAAAKTAAAIIRDTPHR